MHPTDRLTRLCSLFALALAALASCQEQPPPNGPPKVEPSKDASVAGRPGQDDAGVDLRLLAGPAHAVDELAGNWRAQTHSAEYGPIVANLMITGDGWILATVIGHSATLSERLHIESWDGATLRVRREDDSYDIDTRLNGDRALVQVPMLGEVEFVRERAAAP